MDKTSITVKIAWILVGVIFIFLALSVGTANSNLANEKMKNATLSTQIADLETKLAIAKADLGKQVKIAQDLQFSLDQARSETENLRVTNRDLESRLNAAAQALELTASKEEASLVSPKEEVSPVSP